MRLIQRKQGGGGIVKGSELLTKNLQRAKDILGIPLQNEIRNIMKNNSWDTLQQQYLKSGDMKSLQRLRDLHFIAYAPETIATNVEGMPLRLYQTTSFNPKSYLTSDINIASIRGNAQPVYANMRKAIVVDNYNKPLSQMKGYLKKRVSESPGSIIKHVNEQLGNGTSVISNKYTVTYPQQLKLADHTTYDDKGNIIPLSQRDNFWNTDNRYGWTIPIAVGGTTILLNGDKFNLINKDSNIY